MTGEDGLFKQLKKALIERALGTELTEHLGYAKGDPARRGRGNSRNGVSSKTLLSDDGEVQIAILRDRTGTFKPQFIPKGQTRFDCAVEWNKGSEALTHFCETNLSCRRNFIKSESEPKIDSTAFNVDATCT